jgi:hypothetical protein
VLESRVDVYRFYLLFRVLWKWWSWTRGAEEEKIYFRLTLLALRLPEVATSIFNFSMCLVRVSYGIQIRSCDQGISARSSLVAFQRLSSSLFSPLPSCTAPFRALSLGELHLPLQTLLSQTDTTRRVGNNAPARTLALICSTPRQCFPVDPATVGLASTIMLVRYLAFLGRRRRAHATSFVDFTLAGFIRGKEGINRRRLCYDKANGEHALCSARIRSFRLLFY